MTSIVTVSSLLSTPPGCVIDCARALVDHVVKRAISKSEKIAQGVNVLYECYWHCSMGAWRVNFTNSGDYLILRIRSLAKSLLSRAAERIISSCEARVLGAVLERDPCIALECGSESGTLLASACEVKTTKLRSL